MTRYTHHVLPSGMVFSVPFPERLVTYGTYCSPTSFIPFESERALAERDRANGARVALETLRSEAPGDYSPAPSCPSCALGAARRLPPLGFPLEPLPGSASASGSSPSCSTSARRRNDGSAEAGTSNVPPGSTSPMP